MEKDFADLRHKDSLALIAIMDVFLIVACVWIAMWMLRPDPQHEAWVFGMAPLVAAPVFVRFGLYRAVLRYMGASALVAIVQAASLHVLLLAIFFALFKHGMMYRFLAIYWLACLVLIGGSRIILRSAVRWIARVERQSVRVAIFGAGSAGAQLAETLRLSTEYYPVAFVDDKRELHGREILGLKVFPTTDLGKLKQKYGVKEVLLAIPSASQDRRHVVTRLLEAHRVHVKTVPTLEELMSGASNLKEVRELDLNDLIERELAAPNMTLLEQCITGKSVMVTGAGGSIGSELCRQILKHHPKRLVLFERSEYALYKIEREIQGLTGGPTNGSGMEVVALLGSVTDESYLELVLSSFGVQTLYHAAAYKHVPLVEHNPVQGIVNNVFGTLYTARAAIEAGVETFTLVSTDKAVRPTNVMGATKRMAELIIQALSARHRQTRFSIVRFGNVLGSSGSVVPLFREQIRKGGPVTITHRDITRYFMTIPEAAQLVIQAGAMGSDGEVFVLDMGEPVRILDLARRMILLNGLTVREESNPRGDIAIEVTALRPGEKLHEELVIGGPVTKTVHSRIMRVKEDQLPWVRLQEILDRLETASENFDSKSACESLASATGYKQGRVVDFLYGMPEKRQHLRLEVAARAQNE